MRELNDEQLKPVNGGSEPCLTHVVCAGDTILSIARMYGVTPAAIMNRNPWLDPDCLVVGDSIKIPPLLMCGADF